MSLKPIYLTKREREVADLILRGLTRIDIAAILNVSDNTAKKHITNIVNKCDSANQKEAVATLLKNDCIYGENELNAKFFAERRHVKIKILNDKINSIMTADSTQICCKDGVSLKDGDVYCDGSIESVEINGKAIQPLREEKGRFWYQDVFDPPINKGDRINRFLTANLIDSFNFPSDYFFIEQLIPCELLVIEVDLGDRFLLKEVEYEAKVGTNTYKPKSELRKESSRGIEWTINHPLVFSSYTIRWIIEET